MGYPSFGASLEKSRLGCLKFCSFVVKTPAGVFKVLLLHGQDPGRDTSSVVASWSRYCKFCGFVVKVPAWIPQVLSLRGQDSVVLHLKLCRFVVKMPVGIPQVLGLRWKNPDWDTSTFVPS